MACSLFISLVTSEPVLCVLASCTVITYPVLSRATVNIVANVCLRVVLHCFLIFSDVNVCVCVLFFCTGVDYDPGTCMCACLCVELCEEEKLYKLLTCSII